MADVSKKTVSIYIDQSSAENALEKLQKQADALGKKTEEARRRQQELNAEITKASAAAQSIDKLRREYTELEKSVAKTGRSYDVTAASQKKLQAENKSLSASLEAAQQKSVQLAEQISKNEASGNATFRLKKQYDNLQEAIAETTSRLRTNEAAITASAQKQTDLAASLKAQKAAQAALNKELKEAEAAARTVSKLTAEEARLAKQLSGTTEQLDKNTAAQKHIQDQIDKGLRPSFNQLSNQVRQLEKELKQLSEDAPGYADKLAAFQNASNQLEEMQNRLGGVKEETTSLMDSFKGVAFAVTAGGLVQSVLEGVPAFISSTIAAGAALSDELADVEKATGQTAEQVQVLNSQLGKINTRTSVGQLRQIAIGLGQINEAASSKNVAALDKIVVALGDEFGGDANQITNVLSVLRNNLGDIKTSDYAADVLNIGNALNVLGANGLATAPVVTDIANRIAGISQQFNVSSGDILGFAATFQELGIETERGSTAIVKLFQKIGAEPEKFAKVAGLPLKEFTDLVNNDMSQAFVKVAQGARLAGSDNVKFSQILKELDADGSGAGEVLSKLAQNSQLLADKQKLAGQALKESSSITEEFTKKNTTLGAEVDKLGKSFSSFISNSAINNFLKGLVSVLNELFAKTKDVNQQFDEQKSLFDSLQKDVVPVINRYEKLKKKANELGGESKLSKEEQAELKKAIEAIGTAIPSAVTQFDAYGRAIGISTTRAREFIKLQKDMAIYLNQDRIKQTEEDISDLKDPITQKQNDLESARRGLLKQQQLQILRQNNGLGGSDDFKKGNQALLQFSNAVRRTQTELDILQAKARGAEAQLKTLKGEDPLGPDNGLVNSNNADVDKPTAKTIDFSSSKEINSRIKSSNNDRLKALRELNEEAERIRQQAEDAELARINAFTAKQRRLVEEQYKAYPELQAKLDEFLDTSYNVQLRKIQEFYDKKREIFQNDATALQQLQQAEQAELSALFNNQVAKAAAANGDGVLGQITKAREKEFKETAAADELAILQNSGRAKIDARVKQLEDERILTLRNTELTEAERLLIYQQTEEKIATLKVDFETKRLETILNYAQQAAAILGSLDTIASNKEDAALKKDKKANDEKRKNYDRLLKSKAISQQEYNRKIAGLDAEDEARQEAAKKKQFERGKRLQLLQVAIGTAQAIVSTLAAVPGPLDIATLGGARIAQIALAVATGAAQAAAIASKKYATGGLLNGPSHSAGGMPVINPVTGRKEAEVEGGEVILSKRTVANNWDSIGPLLASSMHNSGARVQFPWQSRSYQAINYSGATAAVRQVRRYENGGIIDAVGNEASQAAQQQSNAVNYAILDSLDALRRQMATPSRNFVVLQDVTDNQVALDRIVSAASVTR